MFIRDLPGQANSAAAASVAFWLLVLLPATLAWSCRAQEQSARVVPPSPTPAQPIKLDPFGGYPAPVLGKPYPGRGVVKIVNVKEGWIEIDHEEIKDLMAPMEMEFWVRDRSIMNGIKVGDHVDFVVVEDKKGQFVTQLTKITP